MRRGFLSAKGMTINMIEKVMDALIGKDFRTLASCFSENCQYFDYCPSLNGGSNSFIYGNDCLEMFFMQRFLSRVFEAAEPLVENESRATFFGAYDGPYIYARFSIEEYDSEGLIKKAVVHPA